MTQSNHVDNFHTSLPDPADLPYKTDGSQMSMPEFMVDQYMLACDIQNKPYDKLVIQEIERIYA